MLLEFTDGARRPGSVSNIASARAHRLRTTRSSAVRATYLLRTDELSRFRCGRDCDSLAADRNSGAGPHTALVLREAKLGDTGLTFRGVRLDQGGALDLGIECWSGMARNTCWWAW